MINIKNYFRNRYTVAERHRLRRLVGITWNQWAREVMDREARDFVGRLDYGHLDALEVSGNYWSDFGFRSFEIIKFPEFDLCGDKIEKEKWDIIFLEQVLEHVPYARKAVENLYSMLKPEGHLVVTTPFLIRVHKDPLDCSRWTDVGLKFLLHEAGFDLTRITTASWGNRSCLIANLTDWPTYNRYKLHSLKNDPRYPVVVWAFAQK